MAEGIEIIAPRHLAFEASSVPMNHVYWAEITPETGRVAFEAIHPQGIKLIHPDALHERAWELAQQFNRPTAYDAYYLALGKSPAATSGRPKAACTRRCGRPSSGSIGWGVIPRARRASSQVTSPRLQPA